LLLTGILNNPFQKLTIHPDMASIKLIPLENKKHYCCCKLLHVTVDCLVTIEMPKCKTQVKRINQVRYKQFVFFIVIHYYSSGAKVDEEEGKKNCRIQ
jgi:hypothetical protein